MKYTYHKCSKTSWEKDFSKLHNKQCRRDIVATWAVWKGMFAVPWGRPAAVLWWSVDVFGRKGLRFVTLTRHADMVVNVYLEGGLLRFCGGAWMFLGERASVSWHWLAVRIWLLMFTMLMFTMLISLLMFTMLISLLMFTLTEAYCGSVVERGCFWAKGPQVRDSDLPCGYGCLCLPWGRPAAVLWWSVDVFWATGLRVRDSGSLRGYVC